jgi:hypothetical protein
MDGRLECGRWYIGRWVGMGVGGSMEMEIETKLRLGE